MISLGNEPLSVNGKDQISVAGGVSVEMCKKRVQRVFGDEMKKPGLLLDGIVGLR